MCLVCLETESVRKDFSLSRHDDTTTQKEKFERYTGASRADILSDLKRKIHQQQSDFSKPVSVEESSLQASFAVSLELAKPKKLLSEVWELNLKEQLKVSFKTFTPCSLTQTSSLTPLTRHSEGSLKSCSWNLNAALREQPQELQLELCELRQPLLSGETQEGNRIL